MAALFFSLTAQAQIYSQLYSGRQEMFLEAEAYHLFEEYNEALPLYLELLKSQPGNSYLNYMAGICYLNIPGEKEKAIEYLEKAIENIDHRNRRPTYRTVNAPQDALFYLGNAYHINYQFGKALETYQKFREILNPSVYNYEIVDEHIQSTRNALESTLNPVFFLEENLGERINTRYSETNPVVSGNEKVLVFSRRLPFYDGVFFSEKTEEGEWSWPVEITPQIGSDGDCYPVSLSYDGTELYLYKSDDLIGNIYVSRFADGMWTRIRKLNDNINTRYWESHASISKDGNTLYFTSNRPGGYGGLDIYYSRRDSRGEWGPAVNLGPKINTPYNEDTPFITEDGNTLYFSSYGHYNIGGYDIFYSTLLDDGSWSVPLNAGYGINTPDDDHFFHPAANGIYAYVSRFDDEEGSSASIYRYEIFSGTHPRKFLLSGIMNRQGGLAAGPTARIIVVDPSTGDTLQSARPDRLTGEYELKVEAGSWEVVFTEEGYEDITRLIDLAAGREGNEITADASLERKEAEPEEFAGTAADITMLEALAVILPAEEEEEPAETIQETGVAVDSPAEEAVEEAEVTAFPPAEKTGEKAERTVVSPAEEAGETVVSTAEEAGETAVSPAEVKEEEEKEAKPAETVAPPSDEKKQEAAETAEGGRKRSFWWILILAVLLIAAFYYKERLAGRNRRS